MERKSFSLVRWGYKVLSILFTALFASLTAVLCVYTSVWYAIVFASILTLLCLAVTILCFLKRIVLEVYSNRLILYTPKRKVVSLDNLADIQIDTSNSVNAKRYCFIIFKMKDDGEIKISGYATLIRSKGVDLTKKEINEIKNHLNKMTQK